MSNRYCQTLLIGGALEASLACELRKLADKYSGYEFDVPDGPEVDLDWLEANAAFHGGHVRLLDAESAGDVFDDAIEFCREYGLSYDLHDGSTYEYSACVRVWRPGMKVRVWRPGMKVPIERTTTQDGGDWCVPVKTLLHYVAELRNQFRLKDSLPKVYRITDQIAELLGEGIPDLPPFRIKEDDE